ncbi:MAG TPA: DedA family protein [Xanthobacteraceae bacterium]|nr:DedA family protein [Xanthobacteraceae bacterium]
MSGFVDAVVAQVSAQPDIAYLAVFLAAMTEALAFVGSFVPGSTIVIALAALVPVGVIGVVPTLIAAVLGAIIGDGASYLLGWRYKRGILTTWPFSRYPALVERSTAFFQRYGAFAVFVARFLPPIRGFVPVTAGALSMPPQRFFPVNVAAIVGWAMIHVGAGVLAGSAYKDFGGSLGEYGLAILVGVVALYLAYRIARRFIANRSGGKASLARQKPQVLQVTHRSPQPLTAKSSYPTR